MRWRASQLAAIGKYRDTLGRSIADLRKHAEVWRGLSRLRDIEPVNENIAAIAQRRVGFLCEFGIDLRFRAKRAIAVAYGDRIQENVDVFQPFETLSQRDLIE